MVDYRALCVELVDVHQRLNALHWRDVNRIPLYGEQERLIERIQTALLKESYQGKGVDR
jgi:hypothetical protein